MKLLNSANIYISLWCLYFMQGTLYPQGGWISRTILLIVLLISLINVYTLNTKYKIPIYFKGLNFLLLLFLIYGFFLIINGYYLPAGFSKYTFIQQILISLLPTYSAYVYTRQGVLDAKSLRIWIPIWFVVAICSYYYNEHQVLATITSGREEITNNIAYSFVALMPVLVLLSRKPIIQYSLLLVCLSFVLMSMKRGAILIALILIIWFVIRTLKTTKGKGKFYNIVLLLVIGLFIYLLVSTMLLESDYFNQRIDQTLEGSSSGRGRLYLIFWQHFLSETNLFRFLFGGGANYTLAIAGQYAHQDWLEILINHGILGICIYVYYFICFYRSWRSVRFSSDLYTGLGMLLLINFCTSLFSMGYSNMEIYASLTLGFYLGYVNKNVFNETV